MRRSRNTRTTRTCRLEVSAAFALLLLAAICCNARDNVSLKGKNGQSVMHNGTCGSEQKFASGRCVAIMCQSRRFITVGNLQARHTQESAVICPLPH